jgi:hypothetical protein
MNFTIKNENYGYKVAAYGDYVVIGSPPSFRTGNGFSIGEVTVKKYNYVTNNYDSYLTLQKTLDQDDSDLYNLSQADDLLTENGFFLTYNFTDNAGVEKIENEYGNALSIYNNDLAIATRYFSCSVYTYNPQTTITGSCVDIYDVSTQAVIPYFTITSSFGRESGSFGCDVSIGNGIVAIGANKSFNHKGEVLLYIKSGSIWNYLTSLTGSDCITGDYFGTSIKLDLSSSNRIIIANSSSNSSHGSVYFFESSSVGWTQVTKFQGDNNFNYKLDYVDIYPSSSVSQTYDNFGKSLSIYGDWAVIGCPNESEYYEYNGSTLRKRGCAFIYNRCNNRWEQTQKIYNGTNVDTDAIFKDNKFGYSVDIYGDYLVASSVKWNFPFSASYVTGSLNSVLFNEQNENFYNTLGFVYLYKNISGSWSPFKNLYRKKEVGYPYVVYGNSVAVSTQSIVVGSPCLLLDSQRTVTHSVENYRNIRGYTYIYDFKDYISNYQIGNVFYRTGEIVLKTTGSILDSLSIRPDVYSDPLYSGPVPYYDINFNSQVTLFENQIICTIEPGEFNVSTNPTSVYKLPFIYDINGDQYFDFTDVDLILRYICKINVGNEKWWDIVLENSYENSLFKYYTGMQTDDYNTKISTNTLNYFSSSLLTPEYTSYFNERKLLFDFDGAGKVDLNDMFILWKYFTNQLTENLYKKYVVTRSTRSKYSDILKYLDTNTNKINPSYIKPEFFKYQYSSSIDNTGSYLAPYITTVGLYNGTDLVAIGKLGTPIKNSGDFPINILVKWDN